MSKKSPQTVAGIHLSGPNTLKTSVVIMTGALSEGNLKISQFFEKIGGVGRLFSDERLFGILSQFHPQEVFLDCPLTEPPCVSCTRPKCPGVDGCEDLTVAYMLSLSASHPKGRKRKRPINPQTQRLWDVIQWANNQTHLQEPSYSANMAPLVVRAKTLQRRLNSMNQSIVLQETHVPSALRILGQLLQIDPEVCRSYKAFGVGRQNRERIVEHLFQRKWLELNHLQEIAKTSETFHAFVSALIAAMYQDRLCDVPDLEFFREQGWVFLPQKNPK